jgi:hypothetical protein
MNFFVQKVYHWWFKPRLVSGPITAGGPLTSRGLNHKLFRFNQKPNDTELVDFSCCDKLIGYEILETKVCGNQRNRTELSVKTKCSILPITVG